jgi:hypothetical protein
VYAVGVARGRVGLFYLVASALMLLNTLLARSEMDRGDVSAAARTAHSDTQ